MKEYDFEFPSQGPGDGRPPPFRRLIERNLSNRPRPPFEPRAIGVLASGGLDSCILLKHLLDLGYTVRPFYIRGGLSWQTAEQAALERFLEAVSFHRLEPLVVLDLPMQDIYGDHWSVTGRDVPDAGTPDDAVYLPGRTTLLTIKAALWCQLHGIGDLALATLRINPFHDVTATFFDQLGDVFSSMGPRPICLLRPFGRLYKQQVMELGRDFPLHLTFSCISPRDGRHCGRCNKCAERQEAFRLIGLGSATDSSV
jgi:7-cyano-7-deazaguanine synthase